MMSTDDQDRDPITVDLARLPELLTALRLPTIARLWAQLAERSDREGWPAARYLATLLEHELAERHQRVGPPHSDGPTCLTEASAAVPIDPGLCACAYGPPSPVRAPGLVVGAGLSSERILHSDVLRCCSLQHQPPRFLEGEGVFLRHGEISYVRCQGPGPYASFPLPL
jgi:hypothetical protein